MSHFTVLVFTPDEPTDDIITKAMAPFHEYECTGHNDEYVQDIDKTAEAREQYAKSTETRYRPLSGDGPMLDPHDKSNEALFYREPTAEEVDKLGPMAGSGASRDLQWSSRDWGDGKGYRTKIRVDLPEGYEKVKVPTSEVQTLAQWSTDYYGWEIVPPGDEPDTSAEGKNQYGYITVDAAGDVVKCVDRTNPNAKWDWYVVGGRWNGMLRITKDAPVPAIERTARDGLLGSNARREDSRGRALAVDDVRDGNSCRVGDLALDFMRNEAAAMAGATWDAVREVMGDLRFPEWTDLPDDATREQHDENRTVYFDHPANQRLADAMEDEANGLRSKLGYFIDPQDKLALNGDRDAYVQKGRDGAFSTFAVVKDGTWYEKGKMGWWACVSDAKAEGEWTREFAKLLDEAPADSYITLVDAHI